MMQMEKKSFRPIILFLAFLGLLIDYFDRSALAYAITPLQKTFHVNNAEFGLIGAAFGVGYLVMTPIAGILVDRFGAKKIWTIGAFFWSLACGLISIASGFWTLFLFRGLLGVAEAPAFPALMRVAVDWLPTKKQAGGLGFSLVAVPLSSVIGAFGISALILHLGWRWMFLILAILSLLFAIAWALFYRDAKKPIPQSSLPSTSWKFLLFNPALLANNFAFFSFGYLIFFALVWLPGYYEQTYHIELSAIPLFVILPWLIGVILLLTGGVLSDWLWKKTHSTRIARSHQIWICQVVSACCFIPVIMAHSHSLTIAIIFVSLGIGIGIMPNAVFYVINADLARDKAGTSLGIMDAFFALSGIVAPAATGLLSHWTRNFDAAFILMMVLTFTSALGIFIFHKEKYFQTP